MPIEHINEFNEAVAIIEHRTNVEIERRHLEAAVEMVEAREAQILTMRDLLKEAASLIASGPLSPSENIILQNRITNVLETTWPTKDLTA